MAVGAHVMKSIYGNGLEDYADSRLEATKQICAEMLKAYEVADMECLH